MPCPGRGRSVSTITRLYLQPRAVRIAIVATAPPPIVAGRPALGLGGDDRAGGSADGRTRNSSAAAPECAAKDTADRATDDRAAEHVLRGRFLDGSMIASPKNRNPPSARIMSFSFASCCRPPPPHPPLAGSADKR
jgi:hypothetical protein